MHRRNRITPDARAGGFGGGCIVVASLVGQPHGVRSQHEGAAKKRSAQEAQRRRERAAGVCFVVRPCGHTKDRIESSSSKQSNATPFAKRWLLRVKHQATPQGPYSILHAAAAFGFGQKQMQRSNEELERSRGVEGLVGSTRVYLHARIKIPQAMLKKPRSCAMFCSTRTNCHMLATV